MRIGFFTGNIYDDTIETSTIKECCRIINDKNPTDEFINLTRKELRQRCVGCNGCEESKNNKKNKKYFCYASDIGKTEYGLELGVKYKAEETNYGFVVYDIFNKYITTVNSNKALDNFKEIV